MKTPSPPPAPDPYAVAAAQTGSNVETAISNSVMGNANEISPFGTVQNNITGSVNVGGRDIPVWQRTTRLSPEQQQLYDNEIALGQKTGRIALDQADRIGAILSTPIREAPTLRSIESYYGPGGLNGIRDRAEGALTERLAPQLASARSNLETTLVNQGLVRGSEAFNRAMDESNRQENDARLAVIGQAGSEADRMFSQATTSAGFDNDVAQRTWENEIARRTQPINEITGLMGLSQVNVPQSKPFQAGEIAGTPLGQYVYQGYQGQLDAWKTKTAAQAQMMGGLFGMAGSVAGAAAYKSDRRAKTDIRPLGIRTRTGLPLYAYRYFEDVGGEPVRVGVMADEVEAVMPDAVVTMPNGFKAVRYDMVL